jgi:hypothetical protein
VIETQTWRNYTIIKDGLVNVETLPVRLTAAALKKLKKTFPKASYTHEGATGVTLLHLNKLPIINGKMAKSVSAVELFQKQYELLRLKADQKVLNSYIKDLYGSVVKADAWKTAFGDAGVLWLKEQGLTEYGGFAPKVVQGEANDFYMGKELPVKLAGLSSLPKLSDVLKKMENGKNLTAAAELMEPQIAEVKMMQGRLSDEDFKTWIFKEKGEATAGARDVMFEIGLLKFSIICGQTWFDEFETVEDDTMEVTMPDGKVIKGSVPMKEVKISI